MDNAISLADARFWVRPYEFEGDGSTGAALDVATVEVGGKTRTFWLKTLENRLFFREIGRDENWNFGALDELDDAEHSDLPSALANVLARENYGRVVLPDSPLCPSYLLAAPAGRIRCAVPQNSLHAFFERKYPHTMFNNHFLDWRPGAFQVISTYHSLQNNVPEFLEKTDNIPTPKISAHWSVGSQAEWERTLQAVCLCHWPNLNHNGNLVAIEWNLQSACAIKEMAFQYEFEFTTRPSQWWIQTPLPRALQGRLRYVRKQNLFVGQTENIHRHILPRILPIEISGTIHAPTHHEILEAHFYLRDWINQRLPPESARQWLDFS